MKKRITVCCGSILLLLVLYAPGVEVRLTYEEYAEETGRGAFQPYGSTRPELSLTCPEGEWKLPRLLSEKPVYALIQLGDERRLGVLDKVKKSDTFYRRIYLDLNGNRDLTDDRPIDAPRESVSGNAGSGFQRAAFPARSTEVSEGDEMVPYRFGAQLYRYSRGTSLDGAERDEELVRSLRFTLYARCCYRGSVKVGAETYDIWLADANVNGLFDEPAVFRPPGDSGDKGQRVSASGTQIYATRDRKPSYYDGCPLGNVLVLRDKTFKVDLDIPGRKLVLDPLGEGLATVDLAMDTSSLLLCPAEEGSSVTMVDPGSSAQIPQGAYRLMSYRAFRKGKKGGLWSLNAAGTVGSPVAKVTTTPKTRLGFGEPFVPSAEVPQSWNPSDRARTADLRAPLRFVIEGGMKERVTDLRLHDGKAAIDMAKGRGDQHLPTEATFKIATQEGEVVHSGTFEYG